MDHLYREAYALAIGAKHPLLISHKNPDGDTLGAMLAFGDALDTAGKEHTRFCADRVPKQYGFLPGARRVTSDRALVRRTRPDVVFLFDAGDLRFAGVDDLVAELPNPKIVNVDHHVSNARFGHLNIVVTDASSTAEVVHRLILANKLSVNQSTATCLLTGLCFDTSHFSNPSTTASSLAVGGELLRRGARFNSVLAGLVRNRTLPGLRLWGVALSRLSWNARYGIVTTALTLADMAECEDEDAFGGISNFLNAVLNVPTVLVLRELPGGLVQGSFRTTGERDVARLAKVFGGGGHKKAAGFTIPGRLVEKDGQWSVLTVSQVSEILRS